MKRLLYSALAVLGLGGLIGLWLRLFGESDVTSLTSSVSWGLWVALYIYFIGLSAGSFLLSSLVYVFGMRRFERVGRLALLSALFSLAGSMIFIAIDLGKPFRFWHALAFPHFGSVMAVVVWLYLGYFALMAVELWFLTREDLARMATEGVGVRRLLGRVLSLRYRPPAGSVALEDHRRRTRGWVKVLAIVGVPVAVAVHGGVGAIFGVVGARPFWFGGMFPIVFLVSALASGAALMTFLTALFGDRSDPGHVGLLRRLGQTTALFVTIDLLLVTSEILTGLYGGETDTVQAWHAVMFGPYAFVFWVGQVGLAGVVSLTLIWLGVRRGSRALLGTASALTVLGVLAIRLNIVIPGLVVPELPGLDTAFQDPRLAYRYFPGAMEWLIAVGLTALGVLLFSLAVEYLPVGAGIGRRRRTPAGDRPAVAPSPEPTPEPTPEPVEPIPGPGLGLGRRDLLKGGALVGAAALLGGGGIAAARTLRSFPPYLSPEEPYALASPENVIYTTCLQCQVRCALKAKFQDGVLVKIDGSPYSPKHVLPNIPYDTAPDVAASIDGKLCPKGQAGVQTYADPYRLRTVLKRVGPRGSGRWQTIDFHRAVEEIVEGGDLFGEGPVEGLRAIRTLGDGEAAAAMAADVSLVQAGEMSVDDFAARHAGNVDALIDPEHPDLGPGNNQLVFLPGRINRTQVDFAKRFVTEGFGSVNVLPHTSICELSIFVCTQEMTRDFATGKGKKHFMPDFLNSEFVIFWGTGFAEANFGLTPMAELVTRAVTEGRLKVAVIDPRLSKSAGKAWRWIPVKPGGDAALALGMMRWILENERYDASYLANPNLEAAVADGETTTTDATHLVRTDTMTLLRATDLGMEIPPPPEPPAPVPGMPAPATPAPPTYFVVLTDDGPLRHDLATTARLEVDTSLSGIPVKSVFTLLRDRAMERTLEEYAELAGVSPEAIAELAEEFTSHGKRAAIDVYRGPAQHAGGFHALQAINSLNVLIGNQDWKGGLADGGGSWDDLSEKTPHPHVFALMNPLKQPAFGVKISREGARYESSTLYARDGYPATRPWYPLASEMFHDVLPAAGARYPYPVKALWLHMGTPAYSVPGGAEQIRVLRSREAIPLFIATDIVIGETSMYADYIFPDLTYLERWASPGDVLQPAVKSTPIRQPAAAPVTEIVTVGGQDMPISMEAVMLAVAERLDLPGFGADGFGPGLRLAHPDDYYLKVVANLAVGDAGDGSDAVPDADDAELAVFRAARRHLPPSVFDEDRWRQAAGPEAWRKVVYVLNRGGRFGGFDHAYSGDHMAHAFGGTWHLYLERVATTRDSITGRPFDGLPRYDPAAASDGTSLEDPGYPFQLITFKEAFATQSRTPGTYWSQTSLAPENFVLVSAADAARLGLAEGDRVRLVSRTLPDGRFDLGNGDRRAVEGSLRVLEGLRPGTIAVSHHFGHWAYGASDVEIDGQVVRGDPRRGKGVPVNALLRLDDHMRTGPVTDPIGGSVSFFDTRVDLVRA
ncbi:MAG: polysulfide reductase NrfD [Actinobacteria bacterium]|nr:polysulfide reductase NrfD [Actinomycetota bacterium]